jgi:hypothetical protein
MVKSSCTGLTARGGLFLWQRCTVEVELNKLPAHVDAWRAGQADSGGLGSAMIAHPRRHLIGCETMQRIIKKLTIDIFPDDVYSSLENLSKGHKDTFLLPNSSKGMNKKITTNFTITPYLRQRYEYNTSKSKRVEKVFSVVQEAAISFDLLPIGIIKMTPIEDELTLMQKTNLFFIDDVGYSEFEEEKLLEDIFNLFIERAENYFRKLNLIADIPTAPKVERASKHRGRYRLEKYEIKLRRDMVKEAKQIKKQNPLKRWGEIDSEFADRLDIAPESFRHWRHANY